MLLRLNSLLKALVLGGNSWLATVYYCFQSVSHKTAGSHVVGQNVTTMGNVSY